jgi:hypothetical protein
LTKSAQAITQGASKDTSALVTGAASDTGQLTGTATGVTQYLGDLSYDILPRVVVGIGVLILIGTGLWMMGKET